MTGAWRSVMGVLLAAAAFGAVVRSADASLVGRMGGVFAALVLIVIAVSAWRGQRWASGASFLVAVCWVWATISLLVQSVIGGAEAAIWLTWSGVVISASIVGRAEREPGPRFPPMRTAVGEDEGDGS